MKPVLTAATDTGYFSLRDPDAPEAHLQGEVHTDHSNVWVGVDADIRLDKMFGPLVFVGLRITLDFDACEWVVWREDITDSEERWIEHTRIPGQLESDWPEDTRREAG